MKKAQKSTQKNLSVEFLKLDLSSFQSIDKFCDEIDKRGYGTNKTKDRLTVLVNNAGVMNVAGKTKDGFELQLGVNHLGHFRLSVSLLDTLLRSGSSRIVSVSSDTYRFGKIDFDDLNGDKKLYFSKFDAYTQSKLANMLFTHELNRKLRKRKLHKGLVAYSVTPGVRMQLNSVSCLDLCP